MINKILFIGLLLFTNLQTISSQETFTGFFDFSYDSKEGKILLEITKDRLQEDFLYVNSLSAGVGSNDIGLDRGQLGNTRVVRFERHGNKILLIQRNLRYRAISDNEKEKRAVKEAFAESVIWGFPVVADQEEIYTIDLTPMLLSDMHNVAKTLKEQGQGVYKINKLASVVYLDRTKAFPKNSEFESLLTFTGEAKGAYISSVSPTADIVSVRQHHSFIELPDDNYQPRVFNPNCGYFTQTFRDYATPIESNIEKKFITRHRLKKKNPNASISEAEEPIVYYIDAGCPEPIKSALMEGALWWDQAFQYAGYAKGTFQIKELPEGADPMDVRYNMIQWVHRSTRGWSYGASVTDPRTGEIIKGHVSLGSLRVRQDYLIAQGLTNAFEEGNNKTSLLKSMALARLRQLSAHEVGHTLGLAHNFAASTNDRASVMDYPHPLIQIKDNKRDFSEAYDQKIGNWDKRSILYGYQDFGDNDESKELLKIIEENHNKAFRYITDQDARPVDGLHPYAHLWDNGTSAAKELLRITQLRRAAIQDFGLDNIPKNEPYSELEKVLVPLYLSHRYQIEATTKLIGGMHYSYGIKGIHPLDYKVVPASEQKQALMSILQCLNAENLQIPERILQQIPPPASGYPKTRESFSGNTGLSFDAVAAAEALSAFIFDLILNPERMTRIYQNHYLWNEREWSLVDYFNEINNQVFKRNIDQNSRPYVLMVQKTYVIKLLENVSSGKGDKQVVAMCLQNIKDILDNKLYTPTDFSIKAHNQYLKDLVDEFLNNPEGFELPGKIKMPPGSPIGCH